MESYNLVACCDTCGYTDRIARPIEATEAMRGNSCGRPWCSGHYTVLNLEPYDTPDIGWERKLSLAIKNELFSLPTFDMSAYKEECLLVQKEKAEKEAWREAHPIERCPKCGSSAIEKKRRGFKVGRALMGGYLAGSIGADDLVNKCKVCRCEWRP